MGNPVKIHPSAVLMGTVQLADGANVWPNATIRGDIAPVTWAKTATCRTARCCM